MTEHDFAIAGAVLLAAIAAGMIALVVIALIEKYKEWTRTHQRKMAMEYQLERCNDEITLLKARVADLEAKEVER